ncbi:hypothetical protein LOAG_11164 [Loa loa]|uniref:Uncharacterized protein n=1 Tax=Loa loa TaxID=7209 RepID=A0A1S0TNK4_LOALO|nr:hypothetical protein LOAG_11164 [Loa loa]EFO17335.2 hypothetical protein LOAG_11164 [Loa loa]
MVSLRFATILLFALLALSMTAFGMRQRGWISQRKQYQRPKQVQRPYKSSRQQSRPFYGRHYRG